MKIFNQEDNQEVLYIQIDDLMQLRFYYGYISKNIEESIKNVLNNCSYNGDKFIKFSNPEIINFFKNIQWIINYKEYRNMNDNELSTDFENLLMEKKHLIKDDSYFGVSSLSENAKNNLLNYKIISLINFELVKRKQKKIPFPSVIDSDGKEYQKYRCIIKSYLDGDTFVLKHTNNNKFNSRAKVPMEFINAIKPQNATGYTEYLTKDFKSIIIKFNYDKALTTEKDILFKLVRKNANKINW